MPETTITTSFKADIKDLKSKIQEANRNIKLANAEFKAAASAMDYMADSADGIQKKLDQLNKVYKAQNTILESYKKELEIVEKEQGANSAAADNLRIQIANQQAAVNKTAAELKSYEQKLSDVEKTQEGSTDATKDQAQAFDDLGSRIKAQESELQGLKKEYAAVVLTQGENSDAAKDLARQIETLSGEVKDNKAEMQRAEAAADSFDKTIEETGKDTKEASDGFTVMKGVLADLAATAIKAVVQGLKDIGSAALDAWKDFDSGVDTVIKKTGATGAAAKDLENSFAAVSKRIVADSGTIGTAIGEINTRLGYTGADLEDATVAFLQFADVTGTDVGTAVADVSKALAAAGMDASQYQEILDALTVAGQKSGVSVQKVADGLTKYGAQTRALGLDVEEVIALFAQFELSGVNTEAALSGLTKATAKWQKEGKNAGSELTATVEAIRTAGDASKAAEIAIEAFGNKAGPELADAIQSGRFAFDEFTAAVKDSAGAVERTFEETQDAPDKLALAVQGLKTDLAQTTNEVMTELAPDIEKALKSISKILTRDIIPAVKTAIQWVLKNKTAILTTLSAIAAGLIALNVVKIITGLVEAFRAFKAAQEGATVAQWLLNAAMSANPIGLVIAAIAALVAAFVVLWNKSEAFRQFFIDLWEGIKAAVSAAWEFITGVFTEAWEVIKETAATVCEFLTGLFSDAWETIKGVWDKVAGFFEGVWDGITGALSEAGSWLSDLFTGAWEAIKTAWEGVKDFFGDIWEGIKEIFSPVADFFSGIFEGAKTAITTIWEGLADVVKAPINFLIDGLNKFIGGLNKIQIPDWVPGVGGKGINIPKIPRLYRGGVLEAGQVGLLEGTGAEAVVPLENNKAWIAATAAAMRSALQTEGVLGAGGVGTVNNFNFNQTNNSPKALDQLEIYRATQRQIQQMKGVVQTYA